jgi:hypothetical protein
MEQRRKEVSPVDLFRVTARTNCGECGFPSCLAYAVNVVVDRGEISRCPHVPEKLREEMGARIAEQQARGVYVRAEKGDIADEIARRLSSIDMRRAACGTDGEYESSEGEEAVRISLLGDHYTVCKSGPVLGGKAPTPYVRILLYNYLVRGGGPVPTGRWIPIESLPGALSKGPELEAICEAKIASACRDHGKEALGEACLRAGGKAVHAGNADLAFLFPGLPRVPLLLLVWEGDRDFPPRAKLLMDETVAEHLDADSLLVLAELMTDKITGELGG